MFSSQPRNLLKRVAFHGFSDGTQRRNSNNVEPSVEPSVHVLCSEESSVGRDQPGSKSPAVEVYIGNYQPDLEAGEDIISSPELNHQVFARPSSFSGTSVCTFGTFGESLLSAGSAIQPKDRTKELLQTIARGPSMNTALQEDCIPELDALALSMREGSNINTSPNSNLQDEALPRAPSYFGKPPLLDQMRSSLGKCYRLQKSPSELNQLQREMRKLFGKSTIPRVAGARSPVRALRLRSRSTSPRGDHRRPYQRDVSRPKNADRHDGGASNPLGDRPKMTSPQRRIIPRLHKRSLSAPHLLEPSAAHSEGGQRPLNPTSHSRLFRRSRRSLSPPATPRPQRRMMLVVKENIRGVKQSLSTSKLHGRFPVHSGVEKCPLKTDTTPSYSRIFSRSHIGISSESNKDRNPPPVPTSLDDNSSVVTPALLYRRQSSGFRRSRVRGEQQFQPHLFRKEKCSVEDTKDAGPQERPLSNKLGMSKVLAVFPSKENASTRKGQSETTFKNEESRDDRGIEY